MMTEPDHLEGLMAAIEAEWKSVSNTDPRTAPDLAAFVSKAHASGVPIEPLVRLDAIERHKRCWPAGISYYRSVLGPEAIAPGSDLARMLLAVEQSLLGRDPSTLVANLDPSYRSDVETVLATMRPVTAHAAPTASMVHPHDGPGWAHRYVDEQVAKYTLRKLLGRGGFGEVWLADRKDPYLKVAIKFLRPDKVDATSVARFQLEKQALALLDHPGIARIYDSGILPDGSPFAVMEFIEGQPLTEYCDLNRLSMLARMDLFAQVCDAIHHAHQQGFIHRDLSPDNILVVITDGKPCPKIIDFGIAKVVNKNLRITEGTLTIDLKTLVGKPEYMAPEQAEAGQIGIDTRADIFALGVILYELLTGVLPLPKEELRERAIDEVLRTIRGERPAPSTRYFALDEQSRTTMSLRRGDLDPAQLGRLLQGRIRHLPMTALRMDRTKRFTSAAALAKDIRNYLEDRDFIEAAAEPWRDKAFRHIKRFRLSYATASLILVTLIGGVIGTSLGFAQAQRNAHDADKQRLVSEGVTDWLLKETLPSLLDRVPPTALRSVTAALVDVPPSQLGSTAARARYWLHVGKFAAAQQDLARAESSLEQAISLFESPELNLSIEAAEARIELAGMYFQQLQGDKARPFADAALTTLERELGPTHARTLDALEAIAGAMKHANAIPEAIDAYRRILSLRQQSSEQDEGRIATTKYNLALALDRQREPAEVREANRQEALRLMSEAVATRGRLSSQSAETGYALAEMGRMLSRAGKQNEALSNYQRAMDVFLVSLGSLNPRTQQTATNMAKALSLDGQHERAVQAARSAVMAFRLIEAGTAEQLRFGATRLLAEICLESGDSSHIAIATPYVHDALAEASKATSVAARTEIERLRDLLPKLESDSEGQKKTK